MTAARKQLERLRDDLLDAARKYALATSGQLPRVLTLKLWDGRKVDELVPSVPQLTPLEEPPESDWAGGDVPRVWDEGRRAYWPGLGEFRQTGGQAAVVLALWEARETADPVVGEAELLRAAGSDGGRLRDLFRRSPAWGSLVVRAPGGFRLPDLPAPACEAFDEKNDG